MSHVCIFPSWKCQLSCHYCSIRNSKIDRSVPDADWQEWANVLPEVLPHGSVVDIAGGEPFLYEGLIDLLHVLGSKGLRWAITSNAKATAAIERLCREQPHGAACLNVSDHSGNPEAHENIAKLRQAGYHVNVHRVDHEKAGRHEPDANVITYQDWLGDKAVDGKLRHCTAGLNHWVADPQGNMWRCVVALEMGQPSGGNLFKRKVKPTSMECNFGCSACYTEDPKSWEVEMRVLEAVTA